MIRAILRAFLPAVIACAILAPLAIFEKNSKLLESSLLANMPVGNNLAGWYGIKTQESERERKVLAKDTRFSKAIYKLVPRVPWESPHPQISVSIIYSGQDMGNSIHRPEVCLPAQGHLNLQSEVSSITLSNGETLKFTRLTSATPFPNAPRKRLHHIHYYVFVGHRSIHHSHIARTLQDTWDRSVNGEVQSWAYFQAGTYWAPELGISKEEADRRLRKLISELLPLQIVWKQVK